jgi:adenylate cyclase
LAIALRQIVSRSRGTLSLSRRGGRFTFKHLHEQHAPVAAERAFPGQQLIKNHAEAALESAAQQSEMLEELNNYYSRIVEQVKDRGIEVTHEHAGKPGAMPLPATLTIELGKTLSDKGVSGQQVRLYSNYPFRSRKDGGPKDDFERAALRRLEENPLEPVHSFEDVEGRPSLRYVTARRMQASCIHCHNTHPDSDPRKRDWKVGDVRGALEIILPLDSEHAHIRDGLQGTFVVMAIVSASLLGLSILVLIVGKRHRGAADRFIV